MDRILKILFFLSSSLILLALGWYTEYTISEGYFSRIYSLLSISVFFILVVSSSILISQSRLFRSLSKSLPSVVLLFCLLFFSGANLYRAELPHVNGFLELTSYRYRYTIFPSIVLSVKEIFGLTERRNRIVTATDQDETIVDFFHEFDKRILVKFPEHHAFIASNFPGEGATVHSLVQSDPNFLIRPFAFTDSKTILSFNEVLEEQGQDKQSLSLSRLDDLGNEYIVQWEVDLETPIHHWGDVYDGKIYVPGRKFVSLPSEVSRRFDQSSYSQCEEFSSFNETIEVFSLNDGQHLKSIEVLSALSEFPHEEFARFLNDCEDPLHVNDVRILRPKHVQAGVFPNGTAGDMLISMKNINSIVLIDKDEQQLKWISSQFAEQHSPRITSYGTMLVFDNLGSNAEYGTSRITELDIRTKKIVGIWEGTKEFPFESNQMGRLQILDNRIFISESDGGRLIELTCEQQPISHKCSRRIIFDAPYIDMYIAEILD